jgi:hypothetical protein
MSPEGELKKLKKDLAKSRAEIAELQRKLQASLLKKKPDDPKGDKPSKRGDS